MLLVLTRFAEPKCAVCRRRWSRRGRSLPWSSGCIAVHERTCFCRSLFPRRPPSVASKFSHPPYGPFPYRLRVSFLCEARHTFCFLVMRSNGSLGGTGTTFNLSDVNIENEIMAMYMEAGNHSISKSGASKGSANTRGLKMT